MTKPSWGGFRTILLNNKIPQSLQLYYVKRIETFLWFLFGAASKTQGNDEINNISIIKAEDVSYFLQEIDRKTEMSSCSFGSLFML